LLATFVASVILNILPTAVESNVSDEENIPLFVKAGSLARYPSNPVLTAASLSITE
jgi:hypothetical protein